LCPGTHATTFTFDTDPFAGTNIRDQPGRQIVGGEDFLAFSIANDIFSLDAGAFSVSGRVGFVNDLAENLPAVGVNIVILRGFDSDANPLTPFGAGTAANLIADQITITGPGFFVYFNQSLDLPRLVYSTDLSRSDADLKILARMLNLIGGNTRLVGNFGDGSINAFDPFTGNYLGNLRDADGTAIRIPGLWGLQFGNGRNGGDANTLYFAAGIAGDGNVEDHGLLGSIQVMQ
jgi:hypothetical protein